MIEKEKSELKCTALVIGDTMTTAILSKKAFLCDVAYFQFQKFS